MNETTVHKSTTPSPVHPFQASAPQKDILEKAAPERLETSSSNNVALIADDDEFFRMALSVILTDQLGFSEVIEVTSLDEAVDHLSCREDISLALFDLSMPGMKSAASLRAVREVFADLKIAVISGSLRRTDVLLALESGVNGYVPKSRGATYIRNALVAITEGSIYVPQLITDIDQEEPLKAVAATPSMLTKLSPRQKEILGLLVQAKSNKEIARILDLGEGTVKVHMSALFRNLGTSSRSASAVVGAQLLSA